MSFMDFLFPRKSTAEELLARLPNQGLPPPEAEPEVQQPPPAPSGGLPGVPTVTPRPTIIPEEPEAPPQPIQDVSEQQAGGPEPGAAAPDAAADYRAPTTAPSPGSRTMASSSQPDASAPAPPVNTPSPVPGPPDDSPVPTPPESKPVPGPPDPGGQLNPDGDGSLEAPLRELFIEGSALDPQFESLLERVEHVDAQDLAKDLRDLVKTLGSRMDDQQARS